MSGHDKYRYIPYDKNDTRYFGCEKVIQTEWAYLNKRRTKHGIFENEETVETEEEEFISVVVPESDGRGGVWVNFIQVLARIRRRKLGSPQAGSTKKDSRVPKTPPPDQTGIAGSDFASSGGAPRASMILCRILA